MGFLCDANDSVGATAATTTLAKGKNCVWLQPEGEIVDFIIYDSVIDRFTLNAIVDI